MLICDEVLARLQWSLTMERLRRKAHKLAEMGDKGARRAKRDDRNMDRFFRGGELRDWDYQVGNMDRFFRGGELRDWDYQVGSGDPGTIRRRFVGPRDCVCD